MKTLFLIGINICICICLSAQEINRIQRRTPEIIRESQIQPQESKEESFAANPFAEEPVWRRIIYRELDLMEGMNSSLYYPIRPLDGRRNLSIILFDAIFKKELPVYEYMDGYELFEEKYRLGMKDILDRCRMAYETDESQRGTSGFIVPVGEFPASEIRTYYVKECWALDTHSSTFEKKIEALCPLLSFFENGEEVRRPLFWVRYTDLYPFIRNEKVMLSDLNNSWYYTVDDYFRKGLYKGPIVKTGNRANRTLRELYPDPDSLRMVQEEIEKQLESFKKSLSWSPDSAKAGKKQIRKESVPSPKASTKPDPMEERPVPVRSVRRR